MNKFHRIGNYLVVVSASQLYVIDVVINRNVTTEIAEQINLLCNKRTKSIKLYQHNAAHKVQLYLCEKTGQNAVII